MKVIFLDFDGVLNSHRFWEECAERGLTPRETSDQLDPEAIKQLNRIVQATGCHIVVSSTWRLCKGTDTIELLQACLRSYGYKGSVLGMTPQDRACDWHDSPCSEGHRGGEINQWLIEQSYLPVRRFAIVDDDGDMGQYKDRLVKTSMSDGLTAIEADKLIELLR